MMNLTKMEQYKMTRTQNMANIKEIIGEIVRPVAMSEHAYTDPESGEVHNVMAIKMESGSYYRTEVAAFIEAFKDYWNFFEEAEKPEILITGKTSKRGNDYVNFDVIG